MIHPDDRSPDASVNLPELLRRIDNDRELLRELFGIFKEKFPHLLQSLREAVDRGHMREVEVAAHSLKGMLASLAFTRAAASAFCLERMGHQRVTKGLLEEWARLEREAAVALAELELFCGETVRENPHCR